MKKLAYTTDYYEDLDLKRLITPEDYLKTFEELGGKVEVLINGNAPDMLISIMLDLALAIETNRKEAFATANPNKSSPLQLSIPAYNEEQECERAEIFNVLRRADWKTKPGKSESFIELTARTPTETKNAEKDDEVITKPKPAKKKATVKPRPAKKKPARKPKIKKKEEDEKTGEDEGT